MKQIEIDGEFFKNNVFELKQYLINKKSLELANIILDAAFEIIKNPSMAYFIQEQARIQQYITVNQPLFPIFKEGGHIPKKGQEIAIPNITTNLKRGINV